MRLSASIEFGDNDLDTVLEINALRAAGLSQRLQELEESIAARLAHHRLAVYGRWRRGRSITASCRICAAHGMPAAASAANWPIAAGAPM
jgi:hypothetical protein